MCVVSALIELGICDLTPEQFAEQKEFGQLLDRQHENPYPNGSPEAVRLAALREKYPDFEGRYYETR